MSIGSGGAHVKTLKTNLSSLEYVCDWGATHMFDAMTVILWIY